MEVLHGMNPVMLCSSDGSNGCFVDVSQTDVQFVVWRHWSFFCGSFPAHQRLLKPVLWLGRRRRQSLRQVPAHTLLMLITCAVCVYKFVIIIISANFVGSGYVIRSVGLWICAYMYVWIGLVSRHRYLWLLQLQR